MPHIFVKSSVKKVARLLGLSIAIITAPVYLFLGAVALLTDKFTDYNIILSYFPFYFGEFVRFIYYRVFLKKVGNKTVFKFGSYVQYRESSIGSRCKLGYFNAVGLVNMGDDVLCGGYVNFTSGLKQHSFQDPALAFNQQPGERVCLIIGNDIWIGNNSVICANINDRVVIGAGSIVVADCETKAIYGGNPARLLKKIE